MRSWLSIVVYVVFESVTSGVTSGATYHPKLDTDYQRVKYQV